MKSYMGIGKVVGEGKFGSVSMVKSKRYNEIFVLKSMPKEGHDLKVLKQLYVAETNLLSLLPHKNIIRLYDFFETPDSFNIIMEYSQGGTLQQMIESCKKIPVSNIAVYFRDLLQALEFIHSKGFAHRDIKPTNIVFSSERIPKLIDWGFCIKTSAHQKITEFCGTFPYAPPEVFSKTPYEPSKVDIWAIGVTLYEAAFGINPFKKKYQSDSLEAFQNGILEFPTGTSLLLENVIRKMLQINPDDRPTAEEVLQDPFFNEPLPPLLPNAKTPVKRKSTLQPFHNKPVIQTSRCLTTVQRSNMTLKKLSHMKYANSSSQNH